MNDKQARVRDAGGLILYQVSNEKPSLGVEIESTERRGIEVRVYTPMSGEQRIFIAAVDHVQDERWLLYNGSVDDLFNRETGPIVALFQALAQKLV